MNRLLAIAMLLALALPGTSVAGGVVRADALVATARTALEARAREQQLPATFAVVGRVADVNTIAEVEPVLSATVPASNWLRARIGVPVRIAYGEGKGTSVTIWFSATAPTASTIYSADAPRGAAASVVATKDGTIDLARTHGQLGAVPPADKALRLRRAVIAGQAVLAADFEPIPAVQAQQSVRIESGDGPVRLSIRGRALRDGEVGDLITVLPAGASQTVRARVVSDQVVTLED
jgi:flagella basal body P-ring formation protein FlgA